MSTSQAIKMNKSEIVLKIIWCRNMLYLLCLLVGHFTFFGFFFFPKWFYLHCITAYASIYNNV